MKLSDYEYFRTDNGVLYKGNVTEVLSGMEAESVHCCVTSPPYWGLRDYGIPPVVWDDPGDCRHVWDVKKQEIRTGTGGNWQQAKNGDELKIGRHQTRFKGDCRAANECEMAIVETGFCTLCGAWLGCYGLEPTSGLYVQHSVQIFREVRRVLHPSGILALNLGDSYSGSGEGGGGNRKGNEHGQHDNMKGKRGNSGLKPKDLIGIPWRVALALQADGWWLRSAMPWVKRCLSGGTMVHAWTQKGIMPSNLKDLYRLEPSTIKLWDGEKWTRVKGMTKQPRKGDEIELF